MSSGRWTGPLPRRDPLRGSGESRVPLILGKGNAGPARGVFRAIKLGSRLRDY